ncbi:coagulation factor XIII B chain-like isoform X3 [Hyla sarda]|uniref:coagulation factor XIII B chain-like isoform X3 n=1 Tax=Hyla sarda TaxID=327740 RepID=UPI0024C26A91|nr:coagulation factor XIII B chain-like isoform X3 [Hyla sarda]
MARRLHPLTLTWLLLGLGDVREGAGQCRRPSGEGMIPADRESYNVGESVTVRCGIGYRPSPERVTCLNPKTRNGWDQTGQCIGQCRRPAMEGMIPVDKDFYNVGESIIVRCEAGYRSLHERTTCTSRQPNDVWDNPPMCIAQCRKPQIEGLISAYKEFYEVGESLPVQCRTGYWPSHERTYCANPYSGSEWDPSSRCIGNNSQVIGDNNHGQCKKPQISDTVYLIPGDESSYAVGQSLTVQCAPGHHPAQETITCVRSEQWDYIPQCINSTRGPEHFSISLDLGSALCIFVPIFTIKLLALTILLKIQCTLMKGDTRRTWTVIFFRKRSEDEVYDDIEEAGPS